MRSSLTELPHYRRGIFMAVLSSLFAAGFVIPWKLASEQGDPEICVLVMLATATGLNTAALLFPDHTGRTGPSERGVLIGVATAMAALTLLGNYLSAQAVARMSSALLSVMLRLEVFVVALLGTLVLREYVKPAFWVGATISLCGLFVLNLHKGGANTAFEPTGVVFAGGAALCFGSMAVLARRYVARVQPTMLNALRLWVSVLLWFTFARRVPDASELSADVLMYGALAGFFGPFLSRSALLESARFIPANVASLVALSTPVFTLTLAVIVVGTWPTRTELLGGAIMLAGIAIPFAQQARTLGR